MKRGRAEGGMSLRGFGGGLVEESGMGVAAIEVMRVVRRARGVGGAIVAWSTGRM